MTMKAGEGLERRRRAMRLVDGVVGKKGIHAHGQ
jgi:hypothetical protein